MYRLFVLVAISLVSLGAVSIAKADSYGTSLGTVNGVTVYSNGTNGTASNVYNTVNGYQTGMEWQCVEFCARYYWIVYNKKISGGNANTWYANASNKGLKAYANGGTTIPMVGDILCSASGPGHVCTIRAVNRLSDGSYEVVVCHQNWSNTSSDLATKFKMTVSNGRYTVAASGSYSWQGWLRR